MNIIMLGAPGAGKGVTSEVLCKALNIPTISTGDIIRDNIKNQTKLGKLAESLINNGNLVPDDVVIDLVKNRLNEADAANGYILDGFPRTIKQAEALKTFSCIDYVFYLDVPYKVVEDRVLSRRICPNCKKVYNTNTYGGDTCEICGVKLVIRNDDNLETVKKRYDVYVEQTQPLADFYKAENKLVVINGVGTVQEVYERIIKKINEGNI